MVTCSIQRMTSFFTFFSSFFLKDKDLGRNKCKILSESCIGCLPYKRSSYREWSFWWTLLEHWWLQRKTGVFF